MAEQNAPQNDKVKELLAQLRATFDMEDAAPGAAFSSHNQADAFSESGETDENDENGFPNEFNGAQVCPADNDDAVKGGEDGALKGEGAQRNLETDDSLEDEGFFQVESLDTAEASPQTTNLSEAENLSKTESGLQMEKASETSPAAYYQFSILGDLDTAPMPFPRGYNDDEDGTETFIIRPAVVPAGSVPSALGQDGSEENALTQEERFDPNRPTLDESGEDSAFTDEISTCDVDKRIGKGAIAEGLRNAFNPTLVGVDVTTEGYLEILEVENKKTAEIQRRSKPIKNIIDKFFGDREKRGNSGKM